MELISRTVIAKLIDWPNSKNLWVAIIDDVGVKKDSSLLKEKAMNY